jgi:uncharacterized protein (DUF1810 family)
MTDLTRFVLAHEEKFDSALLELETGQKTSHWMWYIFPQMLGLGTSEMSIKYAITDESEAIGYLQNSLLFDHLAAVTKAIHGHVVVMNKQVLNVLGSDIDVIKLKSSLHLFSPLAKQLRDQKFSEFIQHADEVLRRIT